MKHTYFWSRLLLVLLIGYSGNACLADYLPGDGLPLFQETIERSDVTLAAVGDVIMHMPIIKSCYNATDNSYDFRPIFSEIKPELEIADLAVGVLETPLAGPELKYTGYPSFNSPASIADALQWAGLDLVFIAHNHCMDRGIAGLEKTMAHLDKIGISYVGCNNRPDVKRYRMVETKGIKLAFLAYTTSTNGIVIPKAKQWMVNMLDYDEIAADIADAKRNGAAGIILALHTGIEYQRVPSNEQKQIVNRLLELGVDIVLGSHVHVIQPVELRTVATSEINKARTCFVAYSLGNLLSNQRWRYSDCGLMVHLKLTKYRGEAAITITDKKLTPLWVNRYTKDDKFNYRIKLVQDAPSTDPDVDLEGRLRMKQVWEETMEMINETVKK